jgi:ATP-binding cassette subfamily C protein
MENGMRMAFGPKDEVLAATVKNHKELAAKPADKGGVS